MTIGGDHYVLKMKPAFLLQTRTFYIDRMQTQELQKSEWRLRFFLNYLQRLRIENSILKGHFLSVSNIHVWTENMISGVEFGLGKFWSRTTNTRPSCWQAHA